MSLLAIVATIAVVALAGWSFFLVAFARSILPMANALKVVEAVDDRMDSRISKVVERIMAKQQRPRQEMPKREEVRSHNAAASALHDIFGGTPIDDGTLAEQPDAETLEIVN